MQSSTKTALLLQEPGSQTALRCLQDTINVEELRIGDNDTLSAQVAVMVQADWLFLLTDVDFLYTANPSIDPSAQPIKVRALACASFQAQGPLCVHLAVHCPPCSCATLQGCRQNAGPAGPACTSPALHSHQICMNLL